ncbi:hypothetical protein [Thermovibrio sp.]
METLILEDGHTVRLSSRVEGVPKALLVKNVEAFLELLTREVSKSVRENGRILLVVFQVPQLEGEMRELFEELLRKKFRSYDILAQITPTVYSLALISNNHKEAISVDKVTERVKSVLREIDEEVEPLNYSFKVLPYDSLNPKTVLKLALKELKVGNFVDSMLKALKGEV